MAGQRIGQYKAEIEANKRMVSPKHILDSSKLNSVFYPNSILKKKWIFFFPIDGGGSALQSPAADSESGGDEEGTAPGTNPRIDSILKFDFEIRF